MNIGRVANPMVSSVGDLFKQLGLGGGGSGSDAEQAQNDLLRQMIAREGSLYPKVTEMLDQTSGVPQEAYDAYAGAVDPAYQTAQTELTTGVLPPETAKWLASVRDARLAGINSGAKTMVGDAVANLANRGVTSSSTAEGTYGKVAQAIEPSIDAANADYANSMLTMPRQHALDTFNLASSYGAGKSGAITQKRSDMISPYLDMWKTTLSGATGMRPGFQKEDNATATLGQLGQLGGAILPLMKTAAPAASVPAV